MRFFLSLICIMKGAGAGTKKNNYLNFGMVLTILKRINKKIKTQFTDFFAISIVEPKNLLSFFFKKDN